MSILVFKILRFFQKTVCGIFFFFFFLVSDVCLESDALFFDNSSSDVISWEYSFGDNLVSNDQNPIHLYSLAGSYFSNINCDFNGCKNSITKKHLY